jgi:hypothetical protein
MKILLLSRYSRLGASSRLRMIQYLPALTAAGIEVEVAPFFDDGYLERLFDGKKARLGTAKYFTARLQHLFGLQKPDLVWVEKEAFPWLPWPIEHAILPGNVPLVSDYDDAVYHRYDQHKRAAVRLLLGRKIDGVMAASSLVMAGNQYLADRAEAAGARHVEIVPTVVDIDAYSTERCADADGRPRIGWIGLPSTWAEYVAPMLPVLTPLAIRHGALIRAVGSGTTMTANPMLETLPWTEATEVSWIQSMDIGIMPLNDSPWSRGKCGYKLIQYMACGVPVVASPVGVNREIVEHGVNGFLAETEADWARAIGTLLGDAELRHRMGAAGRKKVERGYSLQVYGPKVAAMLRDVALSGKSQTR